MEKKYLKSKIGLSDDQLVFLTYENLNLVDCQLNVDQDEFTLTFNDEELRPFDELKSFGLYEKCIALINISDLEMLLDEYSFICTSDNLMFDVSLKAKVIERGMPTEKNNFVEEYKALCAYILDGSYSQMDYLKGGEDLFSKESTTKEVDLSQIRDAKTSDELKAYITSIAKAAEKTKSENFVLVNKRKVKLQRILIPVLLFVTVAAIAVSSFLYFGQHKFNKTLIQANSLYLAERYTDVTETLHGIDIDKLPLESKYILARSYLTTENMTGKNAEVQRENVMKTVTLKSDERYLNYWIEIGRLNLDEAIDYAKQLNDNDLLIYALLKQKDNVTNDTSMSGEEKEKKLTEINQQLDTLREQSGMNNKPETTTPSEETTTQDDELQL